MYINISTINNNLITTEILLGKVSPQGGSTRWNLNLLSVVNGVFMAGDFQDILQASENRSLRAWMDLGAIGNGGRAVPRLCLAATAPKCAYAWAKGLQQPQPGRGGGKNSCYSHSEPWDSQRNGVKGLRKPRCSTLWEDPKEPKFWF